MWTNVSEVVMRLLGQDCFIGAWNPGSCLPAHPGLFTVINVALTVPHAVASSLLQACMRMDPVCLSSAT